MPGPGPSAGSGGQVIRSPHVVRIHGGYCCRYRAVARCAEAIDPSTGHLEFRCVVREVQ
jgi:hypothetical protein